MTSSLTAAALLLACVLGRDADTYWCEGVGKVRVENIDAPENRYRCEAERVLNARANARAAELLAGGITLQHSGRRDKYRRLLARVILPDGRDLGALLISEGLAREWDGKRRSWCDG